jgi:hypothetical protein
MPVKEAAAPKSEPKSRPAEAMDKPAPKPEPKTKSAETSDKPVAKTAPDKKKAAPDPVAAVKDQHGIYTLKPSTPEKAKPENTGAAE